MSAPGPDVPVDRSLPEPAELADELEVPGEADDMAEQNDPDRGTADQEEQP